MRRSLGIALVLAGCLMTAPGVCAQTPGDNGAEAAGQTKPAGNAKKPAATPPQPGSQASPQATPQSSANPFPEDTSTVPVLPSTLTPDLPHGTFSETDGDRVSLPGEDLDPVRSPDDADTAGGGVQELESTSDVKGLDSLLPAPGGDETGKRKKKDDAIEGLPKETSQEDITVGKYYLDNKNWKAALSRFQSALVLAPDEPEVYWGLAESERHLGDFAEARANYLKVMEYDPGSKHAKEAKKALQEPEMENAKAGAK
jgi:Tetratricopeptide repeat